MMRLSDVSLPRGELTTGSASRATDVVEPFAPPSEHARLTKLWRSRSLNVCMRSIDTVNGIDVVPLLPAISSGRSNPPVIVERPSMSNRHWRSSNVRGMLLSPLFPAFGFMASTVSTKVTGIDFDATRFLSASASCIEKLVSDVFDAMSIDPIRMPEIPRILNCRGLTFMSELLMFDSDAHEARNATEHTAKAISRRDTDRG